MLKIWGRANSVNVKKVLWIAEELELDVERIDAGGAFGVVDTPEFRAMNPMGLVPVLRDRNVTLFESNVIVRYLAAQYGADTLWVADPRARAKAEMWMDWSHALATPFRPVVFGLLRTPPEQRDLKAIAAGIAECTRLFAVADAALAKSPWLSGDSFGLGDVPLGAYAHVWLNLPIERPATPHLVAWYERLLARPAYAKLVATPLS